MAVPEGVEYERLVFLSSAGNTKGARPCLVKPD